MLYALRLVSEREEKEEEEEEEDAESNCLSFSVLFVLIHTDAYTK
jgi:hypothetical protein